LGNNDFAPSEKPGVHRIRAGAQTGKRDSDHDREERRQPGFKHAGHSRGAGADNEGCERSEQAGQKRRSAGRNNCCNRPGR